MHTEDATNAEYEFYEKLKDSVAEAGGFSDDTENDIYDAPKIEYLCGGRDINAGN